MIFEPYLSRWQLTPDGPTLATPSSRLLSVRRCDGSQAMLKIAREEEEVRGSALMAWWNGEGAAAVLAHEGPALLMERALGRSSLLEMAETGRDDAASEIICGVAARLHAPRTRPLPPLVPLSVWFTELAAAASRDGGILRQCDTTARELLAEPREIVVLHGDLHHANVLDFGPQGWRAIDPKALLGERGFDFANIFCNPTEQVATAPGRLARQIDIVTATARLEPLRLLKWILAYAGLSAAWTLQAGERPDLALAVAGCAAGQLMTHGRSDV